MEYFVILVGVGVTAVSYFVINRFIRDQPIVLKCEHSIRPVRYLPLKQTKLYELPEPMEIDELPLTPDTQFITDYILHT